MAAAAGRRGGAVVRWLRRRGGVVAAARRGGGSEFPYTTPASVSHNVRPGIRIPGLYGTGLARTGVEWTRLIAECG